MPSDHNPGESQSTTSRQKKTRSFASVPALALELPFTLAGAIGVGIAMGYFLDRWMHTKPWLTLIFGALGFFAGVREVLRRLPVDDGNPSG